MPSCCLYAFMLPLRFGGRTCQASLHDTAVDGLVNFHCGMAAVIQHRVWLQCRFSCRAMPAVPSTQSARSPSQFLLQWKPLGSDTASLR